MSCGRFATAFVLFLFAYSVNFLNVYSTTPEYQDQFTGCQYLSLKDTPLFGSEDGVLYDSDTIIFTQANLHKLFKGPDQLEAIPRGRFFAVTGFQTKNPIVHPITVINQPENVMFFPHGIYLQNDLLRVINHAMYSGGERVETYRINRDAITNKISVEFLHATIIDPRLNGITNDLVFISDNRFIITDWMVFAAPLNGAVNQPAWKKIVTMLTWMSKYVKATSLWDCQYVANFDAKCTKVAGSEGGMMNGIAFDGESTIVAADTVGREYQVYRLEGEAKRLQLVQRVSTKMLPDNINYDVKTKTFYAGGTKSVFEYLSLNPKVQQIQSNPANTSVVPYQTQVDTVKWNPTKKQFEVDLVFSSNTSIVGLSAALTAADDDYMMLFSFVDKAPMVCQKTK